MTVFIRISCRGLALAFVSSLCIGSMNPYAFAAEPQEQKASLPISGVMTEIQELNRVAAVPEFVVVPAGTSSETASRLSRESWAIRSQLAQGGVCVEYISGRFVHATRKALNGYALNTNDRVRLALLNYFGQNLCEWEKVIKGNKFGGQVAVRIESLVDDLRRTGITVKWNGSLYVVQSMRTNGCQGVASQDPSME